MTNLKNIIILLLLIMCADKLNAIYSQEIYYAYINNRMDLWKNIIEKINSFENKNSDLVLELVDYQYGYIGYCITFDKKEEARIYLDRAEENINFLEKQKFKLSSVYAYKSAFYGMRMELHPLLIPFYGLKSIRYAKLALELDSNNYLAYLQNGNVKFHSPASAGGSKKEGLSYYFKAREILEKDPDNIKKNWNYLNLLTIIGQSYYTIGDYSSARDVYQYILRLEPGFIYVRDDLYPALQKKMKK
jgi:tetratricopeptide (TPR) repeat protein